MHWPIQYLLNDTLSFSIVTIFPALRDPPHWPCDITLSGFLPFSHSLLCLVADSSTSFHLTNMGTPQVLPSVLYSPSADTVHWGIFSLSQLHPLSLSQRLNSPALLTILFYI